MSALKLLLIEFVSDFTSHLIHLTQASYDQMERTFFKLDAEVQRVTIEYNESSLTAGSAFTCPVYSTFQSFVCRMTSHQSVCFASSHPSSDADLWNSLEAFADLVDESLQHEIRIVVHRAKEVVDGHWRKVEEKVGYYSCQCELDEWGQGETGCPCGTSCRKCMWRHPQKTTSTVSSRVKIRHTRLQEEAEHKKMLGTSEIAGDLCLCEDDECRWGKKYHPHRYENIDCNCYDTRFTYNGDNLICSIHTPAQTAACRKRMSSLMQA